MIEYILILLLIAIFLLIYALNTTGRQERKEQKTYERIDSLGGTTYIKQQLKTESAGKIAEKHNLTISSLDKYCQEHGTTINKLLKEIYSDNAKERERQRKEEEEKRKIREAYEKIDNRGGTNYLKQQLKTKSHYQIAREYNITPSQLNKYCKKHGTRITQLQNEIQEQERLLKEEEKRKIREAYEKIDSRGGTNYLKQQLKTKSAYFIALEYNITEENLNQYCQKHGTSITQLQKEIEQEKNKEAYEKIDRLGGIQYIKKQLKTKSAYFIALEYNITEENLNQYCQKHGTSITQLQKEIEQERLETDFIYQLIKINKPKEHIYEEPYKKKEILTEDDMKAIKDFNYRRMKDEQIKNRYNN